MEQKNDIAMLIAEAHKAMGQAYAPYSKFQVGAAVLTPSGQIFRGCNIENASYGLTVCAERNAVFAAVGAGQRQIVAVAVVASGDIFPYPCGACRQVLAEFSDPNLPVYVASSLNLKKVESLTLGDLLPKSFRL